MSAAVTYESLFGTEKVWFLKHVYDDVEEAHYGKGKSHKADKPHKEGKPKEAKAPKEHKEPAPAPKEPVKDENDVDLFGDEEPDPEAEKLKQQRLKDYEERKSKKPALIAKSSVVLEVKPWDDETDLAKLEESVRSIQMDGLIWGASRFIPVAYGIKKLQIQLVVEDEKVSIDALSEQLTSFEDYVQSVDVAAFNKI